MHELAHNYWQGQVASNEFEEPWLDEGLATFYEALVVDGLLGGAGDVLGLHTSVLESCHAALTATPYSDPVDTASWRFERGGAVVAHTYHRPAAMLAHLERLLGKAVFHRAMRRFFTTWRFRHPSTADFELGMSRAATQDLGWFFAQALHGTEFLDYAVRSASSVEVAAPEGTSWQGGKPRLVARSDGSPGVAAGEGVAAPPVRRSVVVVERRGGFRHPVTVEMVFADGSRERREWDGEARWRRFEVTGPARMLSAEVDPDEVLFLDADRVNNSLLLEPNRKPANKLLTHLLFWLQNLFSLTAVLG